MGCICPGGKNQGFIPDEKSSIAQSQHMLQGQMNNIQFEIKKADILKSKLQCIVLGTDFYLTNRNSFTKKETEGKKINQMYEDYRKKDLPDSEQQQQNSLIQDNLKTLAYGDAITTDIDLSEKSSIKNIISVSVPIWRGGQKGELKTLEKGLQNAFVQAQQFESVAFTDIASGLFGFPKQNVAQIFIKVTRSFMENADPNTNKLKTIQLLLRDDKTIQHFEKQMQDQFPKTNILENQLEAYRNDSMISSVTRISIENNSNFRNSKVGKTETEELKQKLLEDNFEGQQQQ